MGRYHERTRRTGDGSDLVVVVVVVEEEEEEERGGVVAWARSRRLR
jgi:hypothetical protein